MKLQTLTEIIQKKSSNQKFALLTNLTNGNSEIFEFGKLLSNDFESYRKQIEDYHSLKKRGIFSGILDVLSKESQIFKHQLKH